jgi:hypothetical protein
MSQPTEPSSLAGESGAIAAHLERLWLEPRGYKRCPDCKQLLPLNVSRCRRRRCPGYSPTWARDTMRKIRVNLREYGGMTCVVAVTAPGEEAGLLWDRSLCCHAPNVRCSGLRGCRVVEGAARIWNDASRGWWRELNRLAKQRADRAIRRLGASAKGGILMYEWELQKRGVWHLHVVLAMETAVERAWAFEYVQALHEVGQMKGFGFIDRKPLHAPQPAERAARYLSKYLAKWQKDGSLEITETVKSAGRTLLSYVSRPLTAKSGCTMRALRNVRLVWAWREGLIPELALDPFELLVALVLLEASVPARAP